MGRVSRDPAEERSHRDAARTREELTTRESPRTPLGLLELQRTAGNYAVQRMLAGTGRRTVARFSDQLVRDRAEEVKDWIEAKVQVRAHEIYKATNRTDEKANYFEAKKQVEEAWQHFTALKSGGVITSAQREVMRLGLSSEEYATVLALGEKQERGTPPRSPGSATEADFTDVNVAKAEDEKYGGALNTLDELTYTFGIQKGQKVTAGTDPFVGIFKPDKDKTPQLDTKEARQKRAEEFQQSKAPASGIQADDQRITERNLAVQAINNLLAVELIPATFKAKHAHNDKMFEGIVMQKVNGKDGKPGGLRELAPTVSMLWYDIEKDPIVRKGLSNLYLLDTICGQVDRHKGNYIIEAANGKIVGVKAIDNDLAFGPKYKDYQYSAAGVDPQSVAWHSEVSAGKRVDELTEIDRDFAQRIIDLAGKEAPLRQALAAYLTSAEIDSTVSRLRSLAAFLRPMLEQNSPKIKSTWK
jgi:hypothetical protein